MAPTDSRMVPLGTPAPDLALPSLDGAYVQLGDLTGTALLVAFLSNHCPFVRHIESSLAALTAQYAPHGLTTVGISSNDTGISPEDDPAGLAAQVSRTGFEFRYLIDADQQAALAFHAACTPDFFLYDRRRALAYRGSFDSSRPGNDVPVTGDRLRTAIDRVLANEPVPEPHHPSVGCGIKWAPGREPGGQVHTVDVSRRVRG